MFKVVVVCNLKPQTLKLETHLNTITARTGIRYLHFADSTPRRHSILFAAKGLHPVTLLLYPRGRTYSSGSMSLLFNYSWILARLARGVKRAWKCGSASKFCGR